MRLSEIEIIQLIEKLQKGEGVPFANQIYQLLFWSDEILSPTELFHKARSEYRPIIL